MAKDQHFAATDAPPVPDTDGATSGAADGKVGSRWVVAFQENFESASVRPANWQSDSIPDDGPFSDQGKYFTDQGIKAPAAYRASWPLGQSGWLTAEAYSRKDSTDLAEMLRVVTDPAGGNNRVLRIHTPAHTDGLVIRSTAPLPERYRISLRVGFADYGSGKSPNGYHGDEKAEPWRSGSATSDNGFYWLAILDALPRPHNNVWIHHHRKVVIDSDNHFPPFLEIYDGNGYRQSGVHPVMMFALDGKAQATLTTGKPFIAYANSSWQREAKIDKIRAVDAYKPDRWYDVIIERNDSQFVLQVSGDFAFGGKQTYRGALAFAENCVYHYNQNAPPVANCVDEGYFKQLGSAFTHWPKSGRWPDYLMFGDPHVNYYEGRVYYDDVKLEVWKP